MKKISLFLFFLLAMFLVVTVACNKEEEAKSYTVTFVTGTTENVASQTVKENEKVAKPTDPKKEGADFLGWYVGETEYDFDKAVTSNLELTAKWDAYFTVTFNTGTDESIGSQKVKTDGKAVKPADPVKEGFVFKGWVTTSGEYDFDQVVTSNLVLTAKWNALYTVGFMNTVEPIASQTVEANAKAEKPADPVKEGFVFEYWTLNNKEFNFNSEITGNTVLIAKWAQVFTVTFKANGEVISTQQVKEGDDAVAPEESLLPTITGQEFTGWLGSYEDVKANVVIEAVYEPIQYLVKFIVDGAEYGESVEVLYGENATLPADPEKLGYTFTGWDKEATNVTENLTITAQFEIINYDIKYYANGVEITTSNPATYTVEDAISLGDYVVADLYFVGWFNNDEYTGKQVIGIEKGTTGALEFYALNAKADANGGVDCWDTTAYATNTEAGKGIDAISVLPETFERDFFEYLSNNDLLEAEGLHETMIAKTWEEFSAVNPNHNGDPKRIWNDTESGSASKNNGYVSLFLYDKLEFNADGSVKDIHGGFLGTEPYKTKYRGLIDLLVVLYSYKVTNSNYGAITGNTAKTRSFMGFVIDGYFYGTQGIADSYFSVARNLIPGINFGYKLVGTEVVKVEYEFTALPAYHREGYVFTGWYLDKECTKALGSEAITETPTLYAGWLAY